MQRLNGRFWRHRLGGSGRSRLEAEIRNVMLRGQRSMAATIVYQSEFSRQWWTDVAGPARGRSTVIYNGVALDRFRPRDLPASGPPVILCLESRYRDEPALLAALRAADEVATARRAELWLAGNMPAGVASTVGSLRRTRWLGIVPDAKVPDLLARASVLLSTTLNHSCPNAVVEAMAAGVPVCGFATGGLPELLEDGGGSVVPYPCDPWRNELPDASTLRDCLDVVLSASSDLGREARAVAERRFDIAVIASQYAGVLAGAQVDAAC